ncbi:MAG: hypothetical protein MZV65_34070 [Chromatiales bacterium]|nr:hypothetical protein [Chromatiales bacterium]
MKRRLYFLFPDAAAARRRFPISAPTALIDDRIHTIAHDGVDVSGLPPATARQRRDTLSRLERGLWSCNLAVFALALATMTAGCGVRQRARLGAGAGGHAAQRRRRCLVRAAHCQACIWTRSARRSRHGEILLMVDVSRACVESIEELMRRVHPAAVPGGSSWTPNAFGV